MNELNKLIPIDLRNFLCEFSAEEIKCEGANCSHYEIDRLSVYHPEDLFMHQYELDTYEYFNTYGEKGKLPKQRYTISGVPLVASCDDYDPEGILIYFPQYKKYGTWDPDHLIIGLYPSDSWESIKNDLFLYVNSLWFPGKVPMSLLRPWTEGGGK